MRRILLTAAVLALAACTDGRDAYERPDTIGPVTPTPVSFTGFVEEQFANTADDTDPVELNDIGFNFDSQDNPTAFDDLLQ